MMARMSGSRLVIDRMGEGERATVLRRRRVMRPIIATGVIGGILGFVLAALEGGTERMVSALPPAAAVAAALVTVVTVTAGSVIYWRRIDELERNACLWSGMLTLNFYFLTYMSWWLLWKGGITPEPHHEILFGATYFALIATYSWKKFHP